VYREHGVTSRSQLTAALSTSERRQHKASYR
jgi:hypothetical protein